MSLKSLLNRIVSAFRPKTPPILDPTEPKPWTAEKLKRAKVSSGTLERDILEQREIRRIETPSGRRAFFRGVAGAVGLKVLTEKVPQAYFEDNALSFMSPEFARLIPEAEAGGDRNSWGHSTRAGSGDRTNEASSFRCQDGSDGHKHTSAVRYYTNNYPGPSDRNKSNYVCWHKIPVTDSATNKVVCDSNNNTIFVPAGDDSGDVICYNKNNTKGDRVYRTCSPRYNSGSDVSSDWGTRYPGSRLCR